MFLLSQRKLNRLLIGITLLLLAILVVMTEVPMALQLIIFVLLMVVIGIPHGAVDHVMFLQIEQEASTDHDKSSKPNSQKATSPSLRKFFLVYVSIIIVYSLLWIALPKVCLVIFLLMSFYHFGQSQLYYLKLPEGSPLKIALYLCWGAIIIIGIVTFNYGESVEVLAEIIALEEIFSYESLERLLILICTFTLTGLVFALFLKKIQFSELIFEVASLALLLAMFYLAPLLVSFAVYFGLWHSLKAIQAELRNLEKRQQSLRWYYQQAWPFSLVSFAGIGTLLIAAQLLESYISPYMLFFIAISVLTMPHMYYMQQLYQAQRIKGNLREKQG